MDDSPTEPVSRHEQDQDVRGRHEEQRCTVPACVVRQCKSAGAAVVGASRSDRRVDARRASLAPVRTQGATTAEAGEKGRIPPAAASARVCVCVMSGAELQGTTQRETQRPRPSRPAPIVPNPHGPLQTPSPPPPTLRARTAARRSHGKRVHCHAARRKARQPRGSQGARERRTKRDGGSRCGCAHRTEGPLAQWTPDADAGVGGGSTTGSGDSMRLHARRESAAPVKSSGLGSSFGALLPKTSAACDRR